MSNAEPSIEKSIVEALADSTLLDVAVSWADIGVETLVNSEFLSQVPLLGQILSLWRGGQQIRGILFVKKLLRFLDATSDVSEEDRLHFVTRMQEDPARESRVGGQLILLLDRLDDVSKAASVGRAFADYLRTKLDYDEYAELARAIDGSSLCDLSVLDNQIEFRPNAYDEMVGGYILNDSVTGPARSRLLGAGLVERTSAGYEVTYLGRRIIRYIGPEA
ncbi:MAG: hypothetical protein M0Z92_07530 [Actinomycetota bacterium]|nr:hypothetical protein [Actinomycetota bacterium]